MVISGSDIIRGASLISRMNRLALRCEHFFDRPEDLEPTGECQVRSIFESKDGTVWFDDSRFNQGLFLLFSEGEENGTVEERAGRRTFYQQ